ncbi:FISUMP domain-containing protein [Pleomorphovibrio marinus]|uniref:FISUMP domain-containing protein n=1 Tax=Pleomorphovibrio marinus TaxID=2164132 RepID=UPI0018E5A77F|nr:FISUMP domain-containing protein [Pleomorphovibrio marinus]
MLSFVLTLGVILFVPTMTFAILSNDVDVMPEQSCGTITDIDGNIYETVIVGGECWIRSNLRVKHYRNGDPIPEIKDSDTWDYLTTGAWCYYDNDPANEEKYGLLYNFYAITDPRGLVPEGWEVPSYCDYSELESLFGYEVTGIKIKSLSGWDFHEQTYPDNESGLGILPGGWRRTVRFANWDFESLGGFSGLWTRTTGNGYDPTWPNYVQVSHRTFITTNIPTAPQTGLSIRIKKENPPINVENLSPTIIELCEAPTILELGLIVQENVDRPECLGPYSPWQSPYNCFNRPTNYDFGGEFSDWKLFKKDITNEITSLSEKLELDQVYIVKTYKSIFSIERSNHNTCNVEYHSFTFKQPVLPAPQGDVEQFFCGSARISDIEVTGEDLVWFDSEDSDEELAEDTALEDGRRYFVAQRTSGCESGERLEVTARIIQSSVPTGTAVQEFCHEAVIGELDVDGDHIQWFDLDGLLLQPFSPLKHDNTYRAVSKVGDCESEALEIRVVLKSTSAPQADAFQGFCFGAILSDIEVSGEAVLFYDNVDSSNPLDPDSLLEFDREYFVSQTIEGCESRDKTKIKVELKEIPLPQADAVQVFCNQAFISDLGAVGENIKWYKDQSLTAKLDTETVLEDGLSYFVTQTVDRCESLPLEVQVNINAPGKPNGETTQEFCGNVNLSDLVITGENIKWYLSKNETQAINGDIALEDGRTYFATQMVQGCESADRLEVNVQIYRPESPIGESSQYVCEGALLGELNVEGTGLTWYDVDSGGNSISPTTLLEHGRSYFVSQTVGGCEGDRLQVRVELVPSLSPVAESQQIFCASSVPKVKDLFAVGEQLLWYQFEKGGSPISEDVPLENGVSYFASNLNATGCESPARTSVEVTIQVCEVEVYNLVTLDGNYKNAYFNIKDIGHFPENRLEIFNRYGVLVYAQDAYGLDGNLFYGEPNVSGVRDAAGGLPTGNYLYVLTYKVPASGRTEKKSGYLHLINTKR